MLLEANLLGTSNFQFNPTAVDDAGTENHLKDAAVLNNEEFREATDTEGHPVLCQYRGPFNWTNYDFDWCQNQTNKVNANGLCFARGDDRISYHGEADSDCGPNGHLAVVPTFALYTQLYTELMATYDSGPSAKAGGHVALYQVP